MTIGQAKRELLVQSRWVEIQVFFSAFFCLLYTIEIYNVISGKLNWQLYHPPFIKYATSSRGIEWYFKKRGCWKILAWSGNPRSVDGSWSFVFRWFLCLWVSIFFCWWISDSRICHFFLLFDLQELNFTEFLGAAYWIELIIA